MNAPAMVRLQPSNPLSGPKFGMRTMVLRISIGASDFSLGGATHGTNILWVSLWTLCAMMS
eukprot:12235327-Prorocentrum_lima.AAC.1